MEAMIKFALYYTLQMTNMIVCFISVCQSFRSLKWKSWSAKKWQRS